MTLGTLRIVIAEDHFLVREGTRRLLEASESIEVVATVANKADLLDAVDRVEPNVVVTDIRMPPAHHTEGIEAAHEIRNDHPDTGIVVLSQYANALYAFELFKGGTEGLAYLLKDRVGDLDQLLDAVAAVADGRSVIDPQVVEGLLARGDVTRRSGLHELTLREREVLGEMAQGKSNRSIADQLFVSESAVEKHISAIFSKLQLDQGDSTTHRRVAAVLAFLQAHPDDINEDQ